MPAPKPLTRRVLDALRSCKLTLEDVARALNRTPQHLTKTINGCVSSPRTSKALADFFGFKIHGQEPSPRPCALMLPVGTRIGGLDPEYAAALVDFFGHSTLNKKGELVLQRRRRILFSPPRATSELKNGSDPSSLPRPRILP